jgi:serine/threonine protein kinase
MGSAEAPGRGPGSDAPTEAYGVDPKSEFAGIAPTGRLPSASAVLEAPAPAPKEADPGRDGDLRRFVDSVAAVGLMAEADLRAFLDRLPADGRPADAGQVARALVKAGTLTGYQAAAVLQGKTKGLVIGPYLVLDRLGSGGMGLVLKARHRETGRVVALKLLPPSFARDRAAVLRFRREAESMSRFRHPNVVSSLDAGEANGLPFLVMEFVDGSDLNRFVREKGPMAPELAIDCLIQAARGLAEAHAQGIIHRDIKPSNLLRDRSGRVRVLDLGLARVLGTGDPLAESTSGELTHSGAIMGTVDFMSPEQAYNAKLADARSDIYSLGCTLHFLLTGRPPYRGEGLMERLLGHRERPIPVLREARADVSPALEAAFRGMLAKAPDDRPQAMAAVIAELDACRRAPEVASSGRLMVFDDRDETDAVVDDNPATPPVDPGLNAFVRARGRDESEISREDRPSPMAWVLAVMAALALVALLLLYASSGLVRGDVVSPPGAVEPCDRP